ncbi:MAG: WYL domain-containing protein [Thermodesulfobacteriota bacterium]|nr:WYL domain-containing protein [Thermodesulfobacteriota bacterium]
MGGDKNCQSSPWPSLRLGVRRQDDFIRHSFKVMHDELYTVKVRISPDWARWVGEKIWHESQKVTKLPDGGLEITFRVAGLDEIRRWVLSFGPECQVLEPDILKRLAREDLNKSLAQYSFSGITKEPFRMGLSPKTKNL